VSVDQVPNTVTIWVITINLPSHGYFGGYISLLVIELPSFQTYFVILMVVDRFSKADRFGMLPTIFLAVKVVELFASMVCKLHHMPKSIFFDNDPAFMSNF